MTKKLVAIAVLLWLAVPGCRLARSEEESGRGFQFSEDWTSRNEESWQTHLARFKDRPDLRILEIGTYEGRSAIWLLDNIATHPTSRIVCLDIFRREGLEERFDHNIEVSGHHEKVEKVKGSSHRKLREESFDPFDIIYIDGCHSAWCVYQDLALSWPLLKDGGTLILDDYEFGRGLSESGQPKTAIDPFLVAVGDGGRVVEKGKQVIVEKVSRKERRARRKGGREP
jgi:predicted O-methyltransferase YrrM